MRILTVVRQVLDAEETVHIRDHAVDLESSNLVMDAMDEYGVEQGIRLRESGAAGELIALAVGSERMQSVLRAALAMGADRAIHVTTQHMATGYDLDPIALSKVVAAIAQEEKVDLIFTGGQQADWDSQALGPAIAERLDWPQATWTTALTVKEGIAVGRHDVDDGSQDFRVSLPLVVTTQQGLNEPRYPTVPNIMRAKKKELRSDDINRFQVVPLIRPLSAELEVRQRLNRILDGTDVDASAAEVVAFLRVQARVIA